MDTKRGWEAQRPFVHSNLSRTLTLILFILVIPALVIVCRFQRRSLTESPMTLKRNGSDKSSEYEEVYVDNAGLSVGHNAVALRFGICSLR